jgi:hypothetical protein
MAPPRAPSRQGQLDLPFARQRTPDRNAGRGGRSFYLFDFDDNLVHVDTRIFLFDRDTGAELPLSTRRFSEVRALVGKPGPFARYVVRDDDESGSYRRFRDQAHLAPGARQPFVEDLASTLARPEHPWKGPSWPFFEHAVFNGRPVALITARGHDAAVIDEGIDLLCRAGHLAARPSWLGVYNVSNRAVRAALGDTEAKRSVPELKRAALCDAVDRAMRLHGESPHHRFGVSDDDPTNLAVMVSAFVELKRRYPENAFFVIDASRHPVVKTEILRDSTRSQEVPVSDQLGLFD